MSVKEAGRKRANVKRLVVGRWWSRLGCWCSDRSRQKVALVTNKLWPYLALHLRIPSDGGLVMVFEGSADPEAIARHIQSPATPLLARLCHA
jgi:hypothetical protein